MPQPERSVITEIALGVIERIKELREYYEEHPEKPLGTEAVHKDEARARFLAMTPEQRAEIINQVGLVGVIDLMRKRGGRT